eukprot:5728115-Amphidinium_carterae.1
MKIEWARFNLCLAQEGGARKSLPISHRHCHMAQALMSAVNRLRIRSVQPESDQIQINLRINHTAFSERSRAII